jgi:hypothetical protein
MGPGFYSGRMTTDEFISRMAGSRPTVGPKGGTGIPPKGGSGTPNDGDGTTKLERARCLTIVSEELLGVASAADATDSQRLYVLQVMRRVADRILSGGQS